VLDAYIISEIKKREEERMRREELNRPRLHIEIEAPRKQSQDEPSDEHDEHDPDDDEGIVRIDMNAASPYLASRSSAKRRSEALVGQSDL
jgi:hypothetical protein